MVLLHADAVAQNGAAADAAGGVDCEDRDRLVLTTEYRSEGVDQGAFAGAGRTGDANDSSLPREGREIAQRRQRLRIAVLDSGGGAGERARVAFPNLAG